MKNQLERIEDYANSLERVVLNDEEQMLLLIGGAADVITAIHPIWLSVPCIPCCIGHIYAATILLHPGYALYKPLLPRNCSRPVIHCYVP